MRIYLEGAFLCSVGHERELGRQDQFMNGDSGPIALEHEVDTLAILVPPVSILTIK